jgi:hypothetical protein
MPSTALAASLVMLTLLAGCGPAGGPTSPPGGSESSSGPDLSAPTTETVQLRDPVADTFWVDVPAGWDSVAYSTGEYNVHREFVSSVSPDGKTVLWVGDPKFPNYWNPDTADPITVSFAEALDYMVLERYNPADFFFPNYVVEKFGDLPGFFVDTIDPDVEMVANLQRQFVAAGLPEPEAHAVRIRFEYEAEGTPMKGLLIGMTINSGTFWQADVVGGIATDREIDDYLPMLFAMSSSKTTNPDYIALQNANNANIRADIQAGIEEMNQRHNANMAWIQQSAQRHQARMEAIWAAGDASMQSYYDRMESMDNTHGAFINYINDEHTVASPTGQTWQVDDGYDRYWMKDDGTYLGGDINFDDQDLLALGLNPSDYQEVTIQR